MTTITLTFADIFWSMATVGLAFAELAIALIEERHDGPTSGALPA